MYSWLLRQEGKWTTVQINVFQKLEMSLRSFHSCEGTHETKIHDLCRKLVMHFHNISH